MFFRFDRILVFILFSITNLIYLYFLDILYLVESTTPTKLFILFHILGIFILFINWMYFPKKSEWVFFYNETKSNFKFYSTCYPLRCQLLFFCCYFYVTFKYSCLEREKLIAYAETYSRQLTLVECGEIAKNAVTNSQGPTIPGIPYYQNRRPDVGGLTLKAASVYAAEQGIYNPYSEVPENAVLIKEYFGFPKFLFKAMQYKYKEELQQLLTAKGININKDPIGQALLREGLFDNLRKNHPMYIEEYQLPNGDIFFRAYVLTTHPISKECPSASFVGFDPKQGACMSLGVINLQADGLNEKDILVAGKPQETWIQTTAKHFTMTKKFKEWLADRMVEELEFIKKEIQKYSKHPRETQNILNKYEYLLQTPLLFDPNGPNDIRNMTSHDFRIIAEEKASTIPECTISNTENTSYKQNLKQLKTLQPKAWIFENSLATCKSLELTPNHGISLEDCTAFNKINVTQFKTIYTMIDNKFNGIQFISGAIKTVCKKLIIT